MTGAHLSIPIQQVEHHHTTNTDSELEWSGQFVERNAKNAFLLFNSVPIRASLRRKVEGKKLLGGGGG